MTTENLKKIGKGALIAGGGAILAYIVEAIPGLDLGIYAPLITALCAVGINALRKIR